jgi:hypothetical protein
LYSSGSWTVKIMGCIKIWAAKMKILRSVKLAEKEMKK